MHRFYGVANKIIIADDGMVDKLVGNEVICLFIPAVAGPEHAKLALKVAHDLLHATGYGSKQGPWVPIPIGTHTGPVYIGSVGVAGAFTDFSVPGDSVNVAARLASNAAGGELLVSDATPAAAGADLESAEMRELSLKGRNETVKVRVLHADGEQG